MDLISGHSRPAYELAAHLIVAGHEVRIVSSRLSDERQIRHSRLKHAESHLNLPSTERVFGSTADLIRPSRDLRHYLTEAAEWADIAHGFSLWGSSLIVHLFGGKVPSILTLNTLPRLPWGDISFRKQPRLYSAFRPAHLVGLITPKSAIQAVLGYHTLLVSWSRYLRQEVVNLGISSERVRVLETGFDMRRFPAVSAPRSEGPVILFFGLANAMRGAHILIRAFQDVIVEYPEAKLILADRGSHQIGDRRQHDQQIRKLVALIDQRSLSRHVQLEGFAPDIPSLINSAAVAVLPFQSGFGYSHPPLTVLECLAMGTPVVSTRVGSLPEIINSERQGKLVEPGDPRVLSDAILETLANERHANRELRRRMVEEKYDWRVTLADLLSLYESATESS